LVHLGARDYDPGIGRFISADPVMVLTDPQQLHGYAYADNNPVTFFDPTGLVCTPDGESLCPGQDARTQPAGRPQCHVEQGDLVDGGRWIGGVAVRVVLHGE
jgi:hypothetical protein